MRDFTDDQGKPWKAIAVDAVVAHGRPGAALAFVPAGQEGGEPLSGNISFNSHQAASAALLSIGEKELRRRLALAQAAVVG